MESIKIPVVNSKAYEAARFIANEMIKGINKKIKRVRNTSDHADILDDIKERGGTRFGCEIDLVQPTSRNSNLSKSALVFVSYSPESGAYNVDIEVKKYFVKETGKILNEKESEIKDILKSSNFSSTISELVEE